MRELAKNCAIAWSILCAVWAIYGFVAGATGPSGTAGIATCCGSMSSITALVAWIVGLIPCALFAVIGGPAVPPPSQAPEAERAATVKKQPTSRSFVADEVLVWLMVAAIVAAMVYFGIQASAPQ